MRVFILLICVFSINLSLAQVGIGTSTPNVATILDINSLIGGAARGGLGLPSVANDTERDQIDVTNARSGILIYHAGDREVQIYDAENGNWETLFALPAVTNAAPTATVNAPTGTTQVGQVLTADYVYSDADNDLEGSTTFQWIRADDNTGTNAVSIAGATSSTYSLVNDDTEKFIAVDVTPVAQTGNNNASTIRSAYVGAITAQATEINFVQQNQIIAETADGTADDIDLQFSLSEVIAEDITVTVAANDYARLDESAPVDIIIPASSTSPFIALAAFNVADDALQNGDETVTFTITTVSNASSSATIGATSTDTVVVEDDDATPANLLSEDFETDGNTLTGGSRYTTSVDEGQDSGTSATDYFLRTDGSTISPSLTGNSTSFFAAQDIDGVAGNGVTITGGDLPVSIEFAEISISSQTTFNFSVDLAEDDAGDGNQDWDGADFARFQYSIDGGTNWITFLAIESEVTGTNGVPRVDTNLDGTGEGTEITDTWQTISGSFTENSATTTLRIRILIDLDSGDEDIAIDNLIIN